jgi:hypothetical protein
LTKARAAADVANADRLLEEVEALRLRAMDLLSKAEGERAFAAAAGLMREARACLELLGRLAGELKDSSGAAVIVLAWGDERSSSVVEPAALPARIVASALQSHALEAAAPPVDEDT